MPIYEYKCDKGHRFEVLKAMRDAERHERCPECGNLGKRMFSTFYNHGWVGRILEWGKPDRVVAREEDLKEDVPYA